MAKVDEDTKGLMRLALNYCTDRDKYWSDMWLEALKF